MEQEYKWRGTPAALDALSRWAQTQPHTAQTLDMDAHYYDTADSLLAAQRAGLRIRLQNGEGVCCLKCDSAITGGMHIRQEFECPAPDIQTGLARLPEAGAPASLCGALSAQGIYEICRVRFTRQAFTLQYDDVCCELALDTGMLMRGEKQAALCEIELEYKSGEESAFRRWCETLSERFALTPEPKSKLARALAL